MMRFGQFESTGVWYFAITARTPRWLIAAGRVWERHEDSMFVIGCLVIAYICAAIVAMVTLP